MDNNLNRKEIRKNAKKYLKRNYWIAVLVTFITVTVLGGGYFYTTNNIFKNETNTTEAVAEDNSLNQEYLTESNSDVVNDILNLVFKSDNNTQNNNSIVNKKTVGKGILSRVIDKIHNKRVVVGIANSIYILVSGDKFYNFALSLICTIASLLLFFLVKNVIVVGKVRYFLEARRYKTKVDRVLFPYKLKKTIHISWILFCKQFFQTLWNFTIIGGIIKYYEYMFIPDVLAENPSISRKEAFNLSKELTKGKKWQIFKLYFSVVGWVLLSIVTFGLSDLLFTNPYFEFINAELYMTLRREKYDGLTRKELLNDDLLDIDEVTEEVYPEDKYAIPAKRKWLNIDYNRNYSIVNLILFFFIFSFIGYAYEVAIHLVKDGTFVNRGSFYGPWLPIYGFGGVLILALLKRFRDKPWKLFLAAFILCGVVEYTGSWILEITKHMKYWDYSGYFFNINGRVCLEGLLVFGLGGCGFTYILGPIFDNLCNKIKPKIKVIICCILVTAFLVDLAISSIIPNAGKGITDYDDAKSLDETNVEIYN